tara:strand:- start:4859 stop:6223 length:1365 start_codon:yes stop_codon:yes gene_type:complete
MTKSVQKENINKRANRSYAWVFFGQISTQVIRLVSNLIMTRILVPEMFGIMSLVYVFISGASMMSDIGLRANIIQSKNSESKNFLNTAWTIQLLRGCLIYLILCSIAFTLYIMVNSGILSMDSTYSNKQLPLIIVATGLATVINSFNSISLELMYRNVQIKNVTLIELLSQIVGIFSMLIVAIFWKDIWVLVIAAISASIVKLYLSYRLTDGYVARFEIDNKSWLEIFNFGKWIFIGSLLGFMLGNGDRIILANYLSAEMLGIYSIAFLLAGACKDTMKKLINNVMYPVLSEITRADPEQAKITYYNLRLKVDFVTMSTAGFLLATGSLIINILYDSRYQEAGWMLEVLSISLIFVGYGMAGAFLMARGDSKSYSVMIFASVIVLFTFLPLAYHHFGIHGAVLAIALNQAIDIPVTFYYLKKQKILVFYREIMMLPAFPAAYFLGHFLTTKLSQ